MASRSSKKTSKQTGKVVTYDSLEVATRLVVKTMKKIEEIREATKNGIIPNVATLTDLMNDMDVYIYNFHYCDSQPQAYHPLDARAYEEKVSAIEKSYMDECKKILYTNPVPINVE